ncbi:arabinosyltransferase domain-containing protein [Nocardia blacklockiae]|uniref:arabinosyltransferase domain-containing protein n=1 Tax=Nocardia blacklockiae TaxID=480036 RepID=UPI00189630AA|nr:arabinosyltransferase domain-containing protein [Nocardia blacklockiae]MBF6173463.1 arabinosyltransferase domain-containing protein [Nocardia blacklockiae]
MRADSPAFSPVRLIALVSGVLAALLAVLAPLLPVREDRATLDWPQPQSVNVDAPLVSYVPLDLRLSIPCAAFRDLPSGTVVSTVPADAPGASAKGLLAKVIDTAGGRTLSVLQRDIPLLSAPIAEIGGCTALTVESTVGSTDTEFTGVTRADGTPFRNSVAGDIRPQVVGVFTDLDRAQLGDAHLHANIDSRFSSSPSPLKLAAIVAAVVLTVVALICLHLIDTADGRRPRRFLPAHWWRFTIADGVVLGTLLLWHVIGANTSDDGYILNMARASRHSGYMANYYRWFGVAEAPFGWPYEVLAWMTRISDASWWMRLPALVAGIVCWLVISREVLPRLGARVRRDNIARWTAGLVFLVAWLPYDNGLRPEPLIALGALLTWCSIERAIATGRLLPAAIAVLIAAFSLAAGPTGLICLAALIAGSRPVLQLIIKRARGRMDSDDATPGKRAGRGSFGSAVLRYGALLAPGVAAGTLVLVVVFADQTLASVLEATRVRKIIGPNVAWFDERTRWDSLLMLSPDGSLARRFGILGMLLCLGVCVLVMLRKSGRIPGTSRGPSARILGIVFMSLLLMMFTPTKWTHHFGVYAGLAGSLAALTAVAVGVNGIRATYNRSLFAAAIFFLLAITFTGSNGWWYVSSYGIPWWDKAPLLAGKGFSTLFLGLAVLCLLLAAWQYYREPYRKAGGRRRFDKFAVQPLTIAAAAMVLFELASLGKAAVTQYPAYSITKANLRALSGSSCSLADDVLVETNTADSLLQPYTGAAADGLAAENVGFTPNGVAKDLTADAEETVAGGANSVDTKSENKTTNTTQSGTGGGSTEQAGINGSTVKLPFGLDPARTPVLGSYTTGDKQQAHLTSQWYRLDLDAARQDPVYQLLTVSAAGRIKSVNKDGVVTYGQDLRVEFAHRAADGTEQPLGSFQPLDIGGAPSWRNMRVPLDQVPDGTNAVRIVAVANDLTPRQWLAVTPPRLPKLATLDTVVGRQDPVLEDWHVGLAFPCQRPFDHKDGVAEVPRWRILPDRVGSDASNAWQDDIGGGPLGWTGLLAEAQTVPGYLNHDWGRDWGSLERLTPYVPSATPAAIGVTVETRSGRAEDVPIRAH